jgi:hypothetical protein
MMASFPFANVFSVFAFHTLVHIAMAHHNRRRMMPKVPTPWSFMLCANALFLVIARYG